MNVIVADENPHGQFWGEKKTVKVQRPPDEPMPKQRGKTTHRADLPKLPNLTCSLVRPTVP